VRTGRVPADSPLLDPRLSVPTGSAARSGPACRRANTP